MQKSDTGTGQRYVTKWSRRSFKTLLVYPNTYPLENDLSQINLHYPHCLKGLSKILIKYVVLAGLINRNDYFLMFSPSHCPNYFNSETPNCSC